MKKLAELRIARFVRWKADSHTLFGRGSFLSSPALSRVYSKQWLNQQQAVSQRTSAEERASTLDFKDATACNFFIAMKFFDYFTNEHHQNVPPVNRHQKPSITEFVVLFTWSHIILVHWHLQSQNVLKTWMRAGGGDFQINLYGTCRFSRYHSSA